MRLSFLVFVVTSCFVCFAQTSSSESQTSGQTAGSASGMQERTTHRQGERTVTGCVTKEGDSYVFQTDEGKYELNADRDLSSYVGKRVKVQGSWQVTGITTTAMMQHSSASSDQSGAANSNAPMQGFGGELRLQIIGTVIGDCTKPQ